MYPFDRAPDGRLVVTFYEGHQVLLTMLLAEVRALVESPERDSRVSDRLFPVAYLDPTEDVAEREWQALVHDDLVRGQGRGLRRHPHAPRRRAAPAPTARSCSCSTPSRRSTSSARSTTSASCSRS